MNLEEDRYEVIEISIQDMNFAIKDIQGPNGIIIRTKSKEMSDDICDTMNCSHRVSCCKDSASSNGWRHNTNCSNYVMCY
jgi:hypothetical protein